MRLPRLALTRTDRAWPKLFGDGVDNDDRRLVAASCFAQDVREDRSSGLADAEEPDRQAFGMAYVNLRREIEQSRTPDARITAHGAADEIRDRAWPGPEGY